MTSAGSDGKVGEDCCANDEASCARKDPDPSLRYVDHNFCNSTPVASVVNSVVNSSCVGGKMAEDGAQLEDLDGVADGVVLEGVAAVVLLPNLFEEFPRPFLLPIYKGWL